jgi:hypothetical protein
MERHMFHKRKQAADDVAAKLFAFESALDAALIAGAELAAAIPQARLRADLSAVIGQGAITHVGQAVLKITEARFETVEAHHQLAEAHKDMGLKVYAGGMGWKSAKDDQQPALAVVEAKAA